MIGFPLRSMDEEKRKLRCHLEGLKRANEAHKEARRRMDKENRELKRKTTKKLLLHTIDISLLYAI